MRRSLPGLAVLIGGVAGVFASWLVVQALTDLVLGPGHSPFDSGLLIQPLLLAPMVLPPLLIVCVFLPRGRTSNVGLFLLGWGCLWPVVLVYAVVGSVGASLSGGTAPSISLINGQGPVILALFFAALPLAGLWLIGVGLRQHQVDRVVGQS